MDKADTAQQPRRILITAGPTHEPIDAVRYLGNRSSGAMGAALAQAALDAGWHTTLALGPAEVEPPACEIVRFTSTASLDVVLRSHFPACDVLIMAAAVADYRPRATVVGKLPRSPDGLTIVLEPTPDLVAACAASKRPDQVVIGFALETPEAVRVRAVEKLRGKGLDAIVANPLSTMGAATIAAEVLTADGRTLRAADGAVEKHDFARWLVAFAGAELDARRAALSP